jgi:hypothetical protein
LLVQLLLERLCGPQVGEKNHSEDEEPEMDEPETESNGKCDDKVE